MFWKKDTLAKNAGKEPAETTEVPETGLVIRIRLWVSTVSQRFRKNPAIGATEEAPGRSESKAITMEDETPSPTEAPAGLLLRLKSWFSGLFLKAGAAKQASSEKPARSKKWLYIGGGAAIVLAGGGFALWQFFQQPQSHTGTRHETEATAAAHPGSETQSGVVAAKPESEAKPEIKGEAKAESNPEVKAEAKLEHAPEKPLVEAVTPKTEPVADPYKVEMELLKVNEQIKNTEIEMLKKEKADLQAKLEALKKSPPPATVTSNAKAPANVTSDANASMADHSAKVPLRPTGINELTVGNGEPRATALTLKGAIEAMNNSTGDFKKKPVK